MSNQRTIEFIVKSYGLPPRTEEKMIRIVSGRVNELSISDFNSIYSCIRELVEVFNMPFSERSAMRLDSSVRDSKTTFHELIGQGELTAGFADKEDEETEEDKAEEMPLDDIICRLEGKLSQKELDVLRQLSLQCRDLSLPYDMSTLEENADEIAEKLEQLMQTYDRDGRFIMPRRPIIHIRFNPLAIRFGRRRYKGNPLAYFMEYIEIYSGMSRKELQRYDTGLYQRLLTANQLNIAIPSIKRKNVTPENIILITQAYKHCDGNASLAARKLQYSISTIIRYWGLNGLSALGHNACKGCNKGRYANTTPLALFREQKEYAGISRWELAISDPGLYRKLIRTNQISEAIPYKRKVGRKRLNEEERR